MMEPSQLADRLAGLRKQKIRVRLRAYAIVNQPNLCA